MEIDPKDIKTQTYHPQTLSGFPVQHVTGVRITHRPTGMKASCHVFQSANKNRGLAMSGMEPMLIAAQKGTGERHVWTVGRPIVPDC